MQIQAYRPPAGVPFADAPPAVPYASHPYAALPPTRPTPAPSYLEVLVTLALRRWQLLLFWGILSAAAAFYLCRTMGKPVYKAEGQFQHTPRFSFSHKRLFTPPNIHTTQTILKSPEVLAKLTEEFPEVTSDRVQVRVKPNTDFLEVGVEGPNPARAESAANRFMTLAAVQYRKSVEPMIRSSITTLEQQIKTETDAEKEADRMYRKILRVHAVDDVEADQAACRSNVEAIRRDIEKYANERKQLPNEIAQWKKTIADQARDLEAKKDVDPTLTPEETSALRSVLETADRSITRLREVQQAEVELTSKEREWRRIKPLVPRAYTQKDLDELEVQILKLRSITDGGEQLRQLANEAKATEAKIMAAAKQRSRQPMQQAQFRVKELESKLDAIPQALTNLEANLDEQRQRLETLSALKQEVKSLKTTIDQAKSKIADLDKDKATHEQLLDPTSTDLVFAAPAVASATPTSSNYPKLIGAVLAASALLFLGFLVAWDLPRYGRETLAAAQTGPAPTPPTYRPAPPPSVPEIILDPHYEEPHSPMSALTEAPRPYIPSPIVPTPPPSLRPTDQLEQLAARITQSVSDRGAIVLFVPSEPGLPAETLVGDLACFYAQQGGKVLVFDARPPVSDRMPPVIPTWAGPSGPHVGERVEYFLNGTMDVPATCFVPTLIASIDYSRIDLERHMSGIIASYRFRRLVDEMRDRYTLTLLIAPDITHPGDDFLTTLAEGVVVVTHEKADSSRIQKIVDHFRAGDASIYGAVTITAQGHMTRAS